MSATKVVRVTFRIEGDALFYQCSAIEHEGELWLVPTWIAMPAEQCTMPERMILLRQFPHTVWETPTGDLDARILGPLPRWLISGPIPEESKGSHVVLEKPDVRFRMDRKLIQ